MEIITGSRQKVTIASIEDLKLLEAGACCTVIDVHGRRHENFEIHGTLVIVTDVVPGRDGVFICDVNVINPHRYFQSVMWNPATQQATGIDPAFEYEFPDAYNLLQDAVKAAAPLE